MIGAVFIYLGAHVYSTLAADDRARVEATVTDLLKQGWWAKAPHDRYAPPDFRAFYRALAMQRLETPMPIVGVTWDGLLPRRGGPGTWAKRYNEFRPLAPPTIEALSFLHAHGVPVSPVLHDPHAESHPRPRVI